eukprot:scaffold2262_cov107-Skeletonema_dohrnii-CCMP3373.AAC.11
MFEAVHVSEDEEQPVKDSRGAMILRQASIGDEGVVQKKAPIIMIAVLKHLEDGQQLDYGGTCLVPTLLYQEVMMLLLPMQSIMREIRWRSHCCLMCKDWQNDVV